MAKIEEIFGAVVRKRRNKLGLSQEAFADKAGIHRTYVSSIELGKVQISIGIAQQLAEALEAPLSKLWREVERRLEAQDGGTEPT
ncbi:MAG: helix-turn-helix transcriptional regulator [Planctomycetes bacterium]|nr:helix-turn-helix transcriptional regulator [Planctomycetota bacterium]